MFDPKIGWLLDVFRQLGATRPFKLPKYVHETRSRGDRVINALGNHALMQFVITRKTRAGTLPLVEKNS